MFFSFWLISLYIDSLYFLPCLYKWANFISFCDWVIFHCIYIPQLLYLFLCQWPFSLFPCPGYLNSTTINIGMHVSFWIMVFSRHIPRSWIAQWYESSICSFLSNLHTALPIAAPTHLVTNSVEVFPFLHTLFVYRFFC